MNLDALDPVIHPPKRLAIMAVLASASSADFSFLRSHLDVSDSDLSKQMSALQRAGYVTATKTRPGRGGTTTYRATTDGRRALTHHLATLQAIVDQTTAVVRT